MATPWNKVAVGALALVAAVAVLIVATDNPAQDPEPDRPELSRLLDGGLLWTRPGGLSATPGSPGVRDGLALLQHDGLTLVDLRTGDERWTVRPGARLAASTEVYSSGGTLLGTGVLVRTRGGVALLSRDDGSVRWRAPVRAGVGERYVPVAADDRTALVTVGSIRSGAPRVLAVDAGTGAVRWTRDGLSPYAIAGGVVVGVTGGGVVAAWELATGSTAWTYTGLATARVALTAGDVVLVEGSVEGTGGGRPVRRVLSAATGELLAQLGGDPRTGPCAADRDTLIACPLVRGRGDRAFETYGLADHLVRTLSGGYRPRAVCLVGPDDLFAAAESAYFAVDRHGRLVADGLPGRPVAVSGDYLVMRTDTGDPPLTSAYRMRK
jgi:hypothetical protein